MSHPDLNECEICHREIPRGENVRIDGWIICDNDECAREMRGQLAEAAGMDAHERRHHAHDYFDWER